MKKRIIALFVSVMMLANLNLSIYASSTSSTSPYGGGELTEYKTMDDYIAEVQARTDLSSDQKNKAIEHYNKLKLLQNGSLKSSRSFSPYKFLSVTTFNQETYYYCGPATLKQTTHYLNGYSSSQSIIANAVGTTSSNGTEASEMVSYLNEKTTHPYASLWWYANQTAFENTIVSTINEEIPVVLHMSSSRSDVGDGKWPYTTSGHYMNIHAYSSGGTTLYVTDPFAYEGGDIETGKYDIPSDVVYDTKTYLIV